MIPITSSASVHLDPAEITSPPRPSATYWRIHDVIRSPSLASP